MHVIAHESIEILKQKLRRKAYAEIKDRLRVILEALEGSSATEIAERLRVGTGSVKRWVRRFNQEGEKGLWDLPRPGQPQKLTQEQQRELFEKVEQGPSLEEGRSRYRLVDLCAWVFERFSVSMKKGGMQNLLFRNGYRVLRTRPVHEKNNQEAMEIWVKEAPFLSKVSRKPIPNKKFKSSSRMRPDTDKREG